MNSKLYLGLNCENATQKLINDFEGIGLIRSEYICRNIGEYYTMKNCQDAIYNYVEDICIKAKGKEVWYRFTDLTTNEINILNGCDKIIFEKYHFLGTKGVRRHLFDLNVFKIESEIIVKLSKKYSNLGVVIPYISSVDEYKQIKKVLDELGYSNQIGVMIEIPIALYLLEDFIKEDIGCFIVGMNDLTTLMLSGVRETKYHNKLDANLLKILDFSNKLCINNKKKMLVAGYFNKEEIVELYNKHSFNLVINYINLPNYNYKYNKLKDLELVEKIKKRDKELRKQLINGKAI